MVGRNAALISIAVLIALTAVIVVMVFNSAFAKVTIDYFAFFASVFLMVDALYKIMRKPDDNFSQQLVRLMRLIIGVCIFTIHVMQYIYGV